MKNLFIIFLIFNIFSCTQKNSDFEYINTFTKKNYNLDLSNKEIRLFFIADQCVPCISKNNVEFFIKNRNYLIITEDPAVKKLYPEMHILLSYDKKMYQLKRDDYSNSIWDIKDNKVVNFENHVMIADSSTLK